MKMPITTVFRRKALALLFSAVSLAGVGHLSAQNAVSNFGQGSGGTANLGYAFNGAAERRVFSFTTGASVGGYDFSSFTLAFNSSSGSPGSIAVGLYTAFNPGDAASPTGLVTNLSLSSGDPTTSSNAVFSGSTTLAASTTYYLLLSTPSAISSGNYYNYHAASNTSEDVGGLAGWSIGDGGYRALGGLAWTSNGGGAMMSIQATASAIPEPSTYAAIAGAAMLGLAVWQRRRGKAATVTAPVAS